MLGRRVRHFAPRSLPPGRWSLDWDGLGDLGEMARSGVYFVRMALDGAPGEGRRMVLVR